MAADILIISLIASYCIFLIYKARKTQKREKRPGVPDAAKLWFVFRLRDECGKDRK